MTSHWDDREDRRLLRRMADGDRASLAALYDRHAPALVRHAMALARSKTDAEDLVQDVFVKFAGMGAGLLGIRSAGAYLHRMLRTAFLDTVRHRAVAGEEPVESIGSAAAPGVEASDRIALERALASLPVEQREVVVLHVIEGLTFREVAAATHAPLWTAASRYRLAIARLRATLGTSS